MHFKIETPRTFIHFAKKQIVVAGWCIDAKTNKYPKQVFLRIGKRVISCSQCKSNQIDFSAEGNVGFSASFKTGNGIKKIEIFALSSDDTEKNLLQDLSIFVKVSFLQIKEITKFGLNSTIRYQKKKMRN